ncbi:outer membrane protein [Methylobacterium sp. sgz302541]|uniref:outer membrane protein n=1 Tax=unclassified Methylobacterium TaxID=2615210 RepID=UPI003D3275A0
MSRTKLTLLARSLTLIASLGAPAIAHAADLLPPPPPPPMPPPVEVGGGWYLRGDVGASVYDRPKYSVSDPANVVYHGVAESGGFFAGVGVGYQVNDFFRADVTGEFRATDLRLSSYNDFSYQTCDASRGYNECFNRSGRNYNSTNGYYSAGVVLANAYFDLGTWYGVTPFVGGGAGVSFNRLSGFSDYGSTGFVDARASGTERYNQPGSPGAFKEKTTQSFAWALHAGVAYDVTPNFKVELAYRYLNMGRAGTGVLNCFCGDTLVPLKVKNLEAHDVKIGLRYLLGGFAPPLPPVYEPGPIVRKY